MIAGVRGRLLTAAFIRDVFPALPGVGPPPPAWDRKLAIWSKQVESNLGTASSVRAITDVALLPLVELLDLRVVRRSDNDGVSGLELTAGDQAPVIAAAELLGMNRNRIRQDVKSAGVFKRGAVENRHACGWAQDEWRYRSFDLHAFQGLLRLVYAHGPVRPDRFIGERAGLQPGGKRGKGCEAEKCGDGGLPHSFDCPC